MKNANRKYDAAPGRRKISMAFVIMGSGLCLAAWKPQGAAGDQSSPKATVRAFVTALAAKNGEAAAACIRGAHSSPALQSLIGGADGLSSAVSGIEVNDLVVQGDAAHATVAAEIVSHAIGSPHSLVEVFHLERSGDRWLILPDADIAAQMQRPLSVTGAEQNFIILRPLSTMTVMVAFPDTVLKSLEQARTRAYGISCLSNVRQIDLGAIMYIQDNDEKMPRKNAVLKDTLKPYVKSDGPFQCPLDPKGSVSYSFNPNVQGASLAVIGAPAKTVLIYEGKNMQLNFRHEGKAAVGFVDGHARLVGPDEAKTLLWNVDGKPAKPAVNR